MARSKKKVTTNRPKGKRPVKRGEYQSVSKKMGLERLEKSTPKSCRERANLIASMLKRGKIPKRLEAKAKAWVVTYRSRAKALSA